MSRPVILAGVLLLAGTVAQAEVRLVLGPRGPELSVRPVARGVWTPLGAPDAATVNPSGDELGDGYPGQSTSDGRLVAAWQHPAEGSIAVLSTESAATFTIVEVPSGGGYGTPLVAALDDVALIAWQATDGEQEVTAVLSTEDGTTDPVEILPGKLVGVHRVGDAVHVLSYRPTDAAVVIATYLGLHLPDPIPVPTTLTVVPLFREPNQIRIGTHGASAAPGTWMPCVEVHADDVLVAWQADHGQLGRVFLTESGVEGAGDFFRGPNGSCQAVLNAAGRH